LSTAHFPERRRHPRVHLPFPASVEGVSDAGESFRVQTILDDMSVDGIYLRLTDRVAEGAEVCVTARFSVVADKGLVVRLVGKVVRVEPKPGGAFGVAMEVEKRRIL
jgi:hypothetical protein